MSVAITSGWVITWEPRPGRRTFWCSILFPTRKAAWDHIVKDAVENRGWGIKDVKGALARDGVKVLLGTMEAHWHCQHAHRDVERGEA